jgi:hypothetical protein
VGPSNHLAFLPCQPTYQTLPASLVCACYQHSGFVEVNFFVNKYALSNLLLLDIYG